MSFPTLRPAALGLLLAAAFGVRAGEPVLDYTVSAHDTLIGLGRTLLSDPKAWPEVARLNHLANPNRIQPGQTLQVPLRLLRSAQVPGKLVAVQGTVTLDGRPAQAGDTLSPGQRLATGEASSAVLQLPDGSHIHLAPLADTTLAESRRYDLRAQPEGREGEPADDGLFAGALRLLRGSVEVLAAKVRRAKPLEVITPTAVVGVRGTEYRVHHADAGSGTEVLEGKVRVEAGSASADVPAGFGAALQPDVAPQVVALAPAPDLSKVPPLFERPLVRFASPAAEPLRVQVAADTGFDRLVRDELVPAGAEVRLAGLEDGTWQLRARRIDAHGIEGYDGRGQFTLKARPEPPAVLQPAAKAKMPVGTVRLAWAENTEAARYRVEVARDAGFQQVVYRSDTPHGAQADVALDQPGVYHWRLGSLRQDGDRGPWGDARSFELRPLPAAPQGSVSSDGKTVALSWSGRAEDKQQAQLARDPDFQQLIASTDLQDTHWDAPRPELPGTVYFRYRAVEPDGFVTPWSSTLKIDIPRDKGWLGIVLPALLLLL